VTARDDRGASDATIVGVALAVRAVVAYGILSGMPLVSDAQSYALAGVALRDHFPGDRAYFWPPGMPALLAGAYAVLGSDLWVSRLVACALGTLQVALALAWAREMLPDARSVRATGWIAALYPPAVLMSGQTYSQHLAGVALTALALFAARLWRSGRMRDGVGAGIAWAVGCATRPSMLSVAPVLVGLAAAASWRARAAGTSGSRRAAAAALGAACTAALLAPIALHNQHHGAGPTLSTNNDANVFYGNNPYTPNYKTSHLGQRELDQLEPNVRAYLERFKSAPNARAAMRDETLRYVREHPGITAWRCVNRLRAFWGFDYLMARNIQLDRGLGTGALVALTALEAGGYALVMALAFVTLAGGWDALRRVPAWTALAATAAYQAPYVLAFSAGTYHYPVMGLLFPFAGFAASRDPRSEPPWLRARRSRALRWTFAVFAAIQIEYALQTLVWM
jgi:hypothetical protein